MTNNFPLHFCATTFPSMSNDCRTAIKSALINHERFDAGDWPLSSSWTKANIADICTHLQFDALTFIKDFTPGQDMPETKPHNTAPIKTANSKAPDLKNVLAPVLPFVRDEIADTLRGNVEKLVAEMVQKHAEELQTVRMNSAPVAPVIDSDGNVTTPEPVKFASTFTGTDTLKNTFNLQGRVAAMYHGIKCGIWSCDAAPKIDRDYSMNYEVLGQIMAAQTKQVATWLYGPPGSGKSTMGEQIAAHTGRPVFMINFAADTELSILIGQCTPDGSGKMPFKPGVLAQAITTPGAMIIFEEPTKLAPELQTTLQTMIGQGRLTIPETGDVFDFAPGVQFLATDNTDGFGDSTGRHIGAQVMDSAFMSRFPNKIYMDRLDDGLLIDMLCNKYTGAARKFVTEIVAIMKRTETAANTNGQLSMPINLRAVQECIRQVTELELPAKRVIEATLMSCLPSTERATLEQSVYADGYSVAQWARLAQDLDANEPAAQSTGTGQAGGEFINAPEVDYNEPY